MSESIEKPLVFLWFGRLRCPKVLKNLRFSLVWEAKMSESIEKPKVFLCFGWLRCPKVSKNLRFCL